MNMQPMSARCHSSSSGVGSASSITVTSTPARATIVARNRRQAADSDGAHMYIRAEAKRIARLLSERRFGLRQLGARAIRRRSDREQLAVGGARTLGVAGQLGRATEPVQ